MLLAVCKLLTQLIFWWHFVVDAVGIGVGILLLTQFVFWWYFVVDNNQPSKRLRKCIVWHICDRNGSVYIVRCVDRNVIGWKFSGNLHYVREGFVILFTTYVHWFFYLFDGWIGFADGLGSQIIFTAFPHFGIQDHSLYLHALWRVKVIQIMLTKQFDQFVTRYT